MKHNQQQPTTNRSVVITESSVKRNSLRNPERKLNFALMLMFSFVFVVFSQSGNAQIAAWNFFGQSSPATFAATTFNANLVTTAGANNVTRGAGAASSAGGNSFRTTGFQNNGIATTNTDYFQVTLTASPGYSLSLSSIDAKLNGTTSFAATPGVSSQFAYSLNGTTFTLIGSPSVTVGAPTTLPTINVSSITALQNVPAGTTVTLRYYASGQTTTGGWGFYSASAASTDNGLAIGGSVNAPASKLAITSISPAIPTQNSNFSVTVQSQDLNSTPTNVVANTDFTLSVATGTGSVGGTFTGTISAGTNSVTLNSVTYNTAESGVSLTATRTAGDVLSAGTSSTFTVQSSATPTITLTGSLTAFSTVVGTPSGTQSYSVAGSNLGVTNITITPPTDFEIRTGANAFSNSPIDLTPVAGTVASTTIDVRYNPAIAGTNTGNSITHVSGAASQSLSISGSSIEVEPTLPSAITFGTLTSSSAVINFSGGNGASRIIVMVLGAGPVVYVPGDGFGPTGVNSNFPSAASQGSLNRIVYAGSANTVTVTGLDPTTQYAVRVYEYNGAAGTTNYLTSAYGDNSFTTTAYAAIPVPMASQGGYTYTENFGDIANWGNNFNGGTGAQYWSAVAINATGTIPDGVKTSASTATFATSGTTGGVQRGSLTGNPAGTIVLLSTGSSDNTTACAVDFLLNFTGLNAGTLSFNWQTVFNSTGDRNASLKVYASTDNVTFTEIPAAAVLNFTNNVAGSGSIVNVALPASFNNSASARLRFYEYNGTGGVTPTGSRPKIAIDDVVVTGTLPAPPDHLAISSISPASPAQNGTFSVTVQSQDPSNVASNVLANTDVTLQYSGGTGTLSGTLTGTINAGSNSYTFTGLSYNVAESFTLTAHRTAGDALADGSSPITIQPPVITVTGALTTFSTAVGTPSASQHYTVSGTNLSSGIVITPPAPFEISTDNATWVNSTSNITLAQTSGVVATTTLYVHYNPSVAGPNSGDITHTSTNAVTQNQPVSGTTTISEPTIPSTVTFGCNTSTSMVINFAGGNGTGRIVVMKAAPSVSYVPADLAASTGVNADFSVAADQGSGDRIVYDGSGGTVTVTGLTSATLYSVAVYEYNGSGIATDYLNASPGLGTNNTAGAFSYSVTGGTYSQNFDGLPNSGTITTLGLGSGPYFLSECPVSASGIAGWQYRKNGGSGPDILFRVGDGSSNSGAVVSYGTGTATDRALGSLATGTTSSEFGLILTNNTTDILTNVTISYTGEQWRSGGSGSQPNTLSFSYSLNGTSLSTGTYTPVTALNFTSPIVTTTAGALDGNLPANQVAKSATFTLSGNWAPGQKIVIKWVDVDDPGSDQGLAIDNFSFVATPPAAPLTQDHDITFSGVTTTSITPGWINGDGQSHLVVMNTTNSFTNPLDGNTYTANTAYTGTGYGNPGEQVIYSGTGNSVTVTNLNPNTQYWFRVYGYNGSGSLTKYLTIPANLNPNSQFTSSLSPPDHLAIISVNGGVGVDVVKNQPFSVVVQAQDASNVPQAVSVTTTVDLSVAIGAGTLASGTITGQILAGQNSVTITGVIYDYAPDNGVVLQADQSAPVSPFLTSGQSVAFNSLDIANALRFDVIPAQGVVNTIVGAIKFSAIRADLSVDVNFTGLVSITATGPGTISSGTTTVNAVAGVATFSDIVFNTIGSYTVTATSSGLSASTSSAIYISNAPALGELVVPQYIGAKTALLPSASNVDRTPIAVCLQLTNLIPNTSYDLRVGVEDITTANTSYGGSNIWTGAAFTGNIITNAFTTDANGNGTPTWVYIQPATSRFEPGMVHNLRIGYVPNGGVMPTSPLLVGVKTITALDIQSTPRTATTADDGAFIKGNAATCIGGKYILFYDNTAGTGSPLYSYQARQMVATNTQQSGLPTSVDDVFRQSGTSVVGDYAGVIPSNNPNGVQRIEVRNADNSILNYVTDADGVWGAVNTVNPLIHSVATLTPAEAPLKTVSITGIISTAASCAGNDGTATVTAVAAANATPAGTLSYSWAPSGSVTNPATGLTPNSYTVTVTNSTGGCTATASVSVAAPSLATVTAGGPTTFCSPGSVTLTAGSGGTSWTWYKNNVATGDITQSISATTTGTYTVTAGDGLGCQLTSAPVTVIANTFAFNGTIYSESMGVPSGNTNINTYTGWQNTAPVVYASTSSNPADVRTSSASSGYTGATGGGNVFLTTASGTPNTSDRNFIISGINTLGYSGITMTFGLRRDAGAAADPLVLEYSTDGINYSPLSFTQPVTNSLWGLVTVSGVIPSTDNLRLRFSKTVSTTSFRIDDVKLTGSATTVNVAASGITNLCPGTSVRLTSNIPSNNPPSNLWSTTATTKSILVSTPGSYSVTVTDINGCTSASAQVVVNAIIADDGNGCTIDACNSVTGVVTNTPVNTNDGNQCTVDACNTSTGVITHDPVNIDDNDPCTLDACDTGTGVITHTNTCSGPTFFTKIFIEGYYSANGLMDNGGQGFGAKYASYQKLIDANLASPPNPYNPNVSDDITITLFDPAGPSPIYLNTPVESVTGELMIDGSLSITFSPLVTSGTAYWVRVTHRNALEVWSAAPVIISNTTALAPYDFTSAQTQTLGGNAAELLDINTGSPDGNWGMFSGDISDAGTAAVGVQDGVIESQDYGDMETAVYFITVGYQTEDITGDGVVESADYGLMENNVYFIRSAQRP